MKVATMLLAFALWSAPVTAHEGGHDARGVVTSVVSQELTIKTKSDRVVVHAKKNVGPVSIRWRTRSSRARAGGESRSPPSASSNRKRAGA